jgi:hypothetical protein
MANQKWTRKQSRSTIVATKTIKRKKQIHSAVDGVELIKQLDWLDQIIAAAASIDTIIEIK